MKEASDRRVLSHVPDELTDFKVTCNRSVEFLLVTVENTTLLS